MKTLMVLRDSSGFPPDIRIEKEARTLIKEGIKVTLLCCQKEGQPEQEYFDGIDVRRITLPDTHVKKLQYLMIRAGLSSWEHPYWGWAMEKTAIGMRADVLHIHDLPLVHTAVKVGKRLRIPVIADLHELYPEAIRVHYGWKGKLITSLGRWEHRERQALYRASLSFTISSQAHEYYQRKYGIPKNGRVSVIGNYVDLEKFDSEPIRDLPYEGPMIAYLGSYGAHRGIEVLVKAMEQIVAEVPDAKLVLVGPHPDLRKLLPAGVWPHVITTGYIDDSWFPSYMKRADVLVHPLLITSPQTNYCCPHKIFEYMAAGKPIVASQGESFQSYIGDNQAGLLFKSGDSQELATFVTRLLKDKKLAQWFGDNGRKAVETKYNWAREGWKLARLYWEL